MVKAIVLCVCLTMATGFFATVRNTEDIPMRVRAPQPPETKSYIVEESFQKVLVCKAKRRDFTNIVVNISDHYGVDWQLVTAVMAAESSFNPCAVSPRGAMGLMQLTPQLARRYKVHKQEIYVPEKNIRAGVQHLKMLSERYNGDLELTVAAYNAGEGAVDKFGGVPPYGETRAYVRKVLEYHSNLQANAGLSKPLAFQ